MARGKGNRGSRGQLGVGQCHRRSPAVIFAVERAPRRPRVESDGGSMRGVNRVESRIESMLKPTSSVPLGISCYFPNFFIFHELFCFSCACALSRRHPSHPLPSPAPPALPREYSDLCLSASVRLVGAALCLCGGDKGKGALALAVAVAVAAAHCALPALLPLTTDTATAT